MSILDFTVEEINMIVAYKGENKSKTVAQIVNVYPIMDADMKEIATTAVQKLVRMTNAEFEQTQFVAAEDEER